MASTAAGTVTQSGDGTVLTYTDIGSYGTVISRVLTIYDYDANVLATINMGASLTATYNITADGYFTFICEVFDDTGGPFTATVAYLSTAFFQIAFAPQIAAQECPACDTFAVFYNLNRAYLSEQAALIYASHGASVQAQNNITQANFYVNTPYYA